MFGWKAKSWIITVLFVCAKAELLNRHAEKIKNAVIKRGLLILIIQSHYRLEHAIVIIVGVQAINNFANVDRGLIPDIDC